MMQTWLYHPSPRMESWPSLPRESVCQPQKWRNSSPSGTPASLPSRIRSKTRPQIVSRRCQNITFTKDNIPKNERVKQAKLRTSTHSSSEIEIYQRPHLNPLPLLPNLNSCSWRWKVLYFECLVSVSFFVVALIFHCFRCSQYGLLIIVFYLFFSLPLL